MGDTSAATTTGMSAVYYRLEGSKRRQIPRSGTC